MMTKELIGKVFVAVNYLRKIVSVDIVEGLVLIQTQVRGGTNRIMQFKPDDITRMKKLAVWLSGTRWCSR